MGMMDRLLHLLDYERSPSRENIVVSTYTGHWDDTGMPISTFLGEMDATAKACISLIAGSIAGLDMRAVDETTREMPPRASDGSGARFNRLMRGLIDGGSAFDFKDEIVTDLLLYGNAYIYPIYERRARGGRTVSLLLDIKVIDPRKVEKRKNEDTGAIEYQIEGGSILPAEAITHIKMPGIRDWHRMLGSPPLSAATGVMRIANLASEQVVANLRNRLSPIAVVLDDQGGGAAALEAFNKEQVRLRRSPWRLFKTGADPQMLDLTPQSPDMLALREDNRLEIARAYHVPSPMIEINTTDWGAGIEALRRLFWQKCLRPIVVAIEDGLSMIVGDGNRVRFNEIDILRGDWAALARLITAIAPPARGEYATVNEVREYLNLPPMPDADTLKPMPEEAPMEVMPNARDDEDEDDA